MGPTPTRESRSATQPYSRPNHGMEIDPVDLQHPHEMRAVGEATARFRAGGPWRLLLPVLVVVLARGLFTIAEWEALPPGAGALAFTGLALWAAWRHRRDPGEDVRRDPALLLLAAFLGALLVILFSHSDRFWGDGIHPYSYLVSIMEDGDLDFENNARDLAGGEPSRTFRHYSIGPAFVWAPGYAVAEVASRLTGRRPDGWNAIYRNAAALASLLLGWSGLVALYLCAREMPGRASALLAALAIGSGTFLLGYLAWAPTESHSSTFAAASWLMYWALRVDPLHPTPAFLIGALLGFATIQRWQAAVLALFVASVFARALWERRGSRFAWPVFACCAGALLAFLPQAIVWKSVFGHWLTIPQGASFVNSELRVEGVLFSPRHGLFAWSPVLYLAIPGFVIWAKRQPWICVGALLTIVATIRTNAGLEDWFGGSAFGGRRFDLTLPFFGMALALAFEHLVQQVRKRPHIAGAALVAGFLLWNSLLAAAYFRGALSNSEPVPFVDQASGVANQLDVMVGSPWSLPASLFRRLTEGTPLSEFEARYMERPFSTLTIRMGLDDRLFLDDGWSVPLEVGGVKTRLIEGQGAGVHLPIHVPRAYRLGLRFRALEGPPLSIELWINDQRVGAFPASSEWEDHETEVAAEVLRAGRNKLRIVLIREGEVGTLAVAGLWFEPRSRRASPPSPGE